MKISILLVLLLCLPAVAFAELQKKTIDYRDGDSALEGYLVYDDSIQGPRPGVLVVHDWMGPGAYANGRADQLAQLGYAAFALDIYGKGVRPQNSDEAAQQATYYKTNRDVLRSRAQAALDAFKAESVVDPNQIAAIGYCFGGTAVLEMARAGMPLSGVVSFHGGLGPKIPAEEGAVKAKVLVLHGADDPLVPKEEIETFTKEFNDAGADWQMVYYSGAVHSFTRKDAGDDKSKGVAYNARADQRSWEAMKVFFGELFNK